MLMYVVIFFILVIPVLSLVPILMFAAKMTGWTNLAELYADDGSDPSQVRRRSSISVKKVNRVPSNFGGITTLGVDQDNLYVRLWGPFKIGHPSLRVPLSEMKISDRSPEPPEDGKKLKRKHFTIFEFLRVNDVQLILPAKETQWLKSHLRFDSHLA